MIPFTLALPTVLYFGAGVSKRTGSEVRQLAQRNAPFRSRLERDRQQAKVLIMTDSGVQKAGLLGVILASLSEAGIVHGVFSDIAPNPRDTNVQDAVEVFKTGDFNVIVAVGGGSVMDAAKGTALVSTHGGQIVQYDGLDTVPQGPITPLLAIPTTSGTGSEVTPVAVITDTVHHIKIGIVDRYLLPLVSLVDPELTYTMPKPLTVNTGLDALTHAIEAYTGSRTNPVSDVLALDAIRLAGKHLPAAAENPSDPQARGGMMLASTVAGIAFGNADVGGAHCLAETLGGIYDAPHGALNAIFLPYVMAQNLPACPDRFADVAEALGGPRRPEEAIRLVSGLGRRLGVSRLVDLGAKKGDVPLLAERSEQHPCNPSNPRPITQSEYAVVLEKALDDAPPL